ncbi:phosphodiester glycosidase family protein [Luteibacter aegosomatissinici]|uniref:phosphodiester glycosidase family protein n=1 Tax=Luteibacter aegosomatissinici TaxID=2911539 RepID=UPI001FFB0C36|nr:phosphodiester glycosidase family protein [Luteibacter aegosomatissinici]UPG93530.1 phosphodiester glycosidase family protein [Luteibacter aegosomatissinici]
MATLLLRSLALASLTAFAFGCAAPADAVDGRDLVFDSQSYYVAKVDTRREDIELFWRNPDSGQPFASIEALKTWTAGKGRPLSFATNAGIYDRDFRPLGLYVENGKAVVPLNLAHGNPRSGNFSLLPNGVFAIYDDGTAQVSTTEAFRSAGRKPRWATQSGPMLVINGEVNTQFDNGSDSMKWRSGVCATSAHDVVFVVSRAPVNFHSFARLFRDELGCRDALFLDGTISQAWTPADGYAGAPAFMTKPYAGMVAVFPKAR